MNWNASLSVCRFFSWVNRECAAEILLSKHVHHYPFIGMYCLFTVAPFPETPKAGQWSGKLWTKAFLPHPPGPQKCSPLSRHRAFHRAFGRPWVTDESPRTFPKYRSWCDSTVKIFLQNSNILIVEKTFRKLIVLYSVVDLWDLEILNVVTALGRMQLKKPWFGITEMWKLREIVPDLAVTVCQCSGIYCKYYLSMLLMGFPSDSGTKFWLSKVIITYFKKLQTTVSGKLAKGWLT